MGSAGDAVHFFGELARLLGEVFQLFFAGQTAAADGLQANHKGLVGNAGDGFGDLEASV